MGSSPLTRGKRPHVRRLVGEERLIPAHAGKTGRAGLFPSSPEAHPRSRGENHFYLPRPKRPRGSSPLTRGKPVNNERAEGHSGLIPAHAGKTKTCGACLSHSPAHPRSRGENELTDYVGDDDNGSSPLTRGKLVAALTALGIARLIPAHAGKTRARGVCRVAHAAHPRSRGENNGQPGQKLVLRGSSPLTRGKRRGDSRCFLRVRLIPAHAGKTS